MREDVLAAGEHIERLTAELATLVLAGRADRKRDKRAFTFSDPVTNLSFSLKDMTIDGALHPVLVWSVSAAPASASDEMKVQRAATLIEFDGRPVTPMDFLRVLRSLNLLDALRQIRLSYKRRAR